MHCMRRSCWLIGAGGGLSFFGSQALAGTEATACGSGVAGAVAGGSATTSYLGQVAVAREARRRGVHGVVCGHIHHAEMRTIDGVLYAKHDPTANMFSAGVL